jgi:Kef-type K+ transport system membrane component KefB
VFALGMMDIGLILEVTVVSLALTTTALGALLPILQDTKTLESKFGMLVLAVGSISQFAPILIISLLFTESAPVITFVFLALFIAIAVVSALFLTKLHQLKAFQFVRDHFYLSDQLPVRVSIALILFLVCLAIQFKLNILLGAFSAGIVVRFFTVKQDRERIGSKLKVIGYSFLIPLFFIVSGINFDIHALASLDVMGRMLFFFVCLLLVRAVPIFIFLRKEIDNMHRQALTCLSATTLPLIVVITHLGTMEGKMLSINAIALIGAGVLSVLVFPTLGLNRLQQAK